MAPRIAFRPRHMGSPIITPDTVGLEVWPERSSGLWLLETKERGSGFD